MAAIPVDVTGSSPISFTDSQGGQKFVPLSALQFTGSTLGLNSTWESSFNAADTQTLLALASALAAAGELTAPPVPPPSPAIAFTATHAGPESNNIVVTAASDSGPPLTAKIAVSVVETDTYPQLASAAAAAAAVGVDAPSGKPGDPLQGTGLVVLKTGSVSGAETLPADNQGGVLTPDGVDIKAPDNSVLFTVLPRADYKGSGGLSLAVNLDASGATFTIEATYDSSKESGPKPKITILTLDTLPAPVAYLISAAAPPAGAALPAAGSVSVALTGGGPGLAASGLLYTS
jgi:hypothetical protein